MSRASPVLPSNNSRPAQTDGNVGGARVSRVASDGSTDDTAFPSELATQVNFKVYLRGLHQRRDQAHCLEGQSTREAFRHALNFTGMTAPEPLIEWPDAERLAMLDVDYHGMELERRPSDQQLALLAQQVSPRPMFWWPSHGRGLHLMYESVNGYTGREMAAIGALGIKGLDPTATVEIKSHSRHPAYARPDHPCAGPVVESNGPLNLCGLARLLGREVDEEAVNDWLAERGLERGRRYTHDRCPCDPQAQSHGDPVVVGDDGIFCHRCESQGLLLGGGSRPGFFPFAAIVGGGFAPIILAAAKGFTHWDHAKVIVSEVTGLAEPMGKLVFSSLLKLRHGAEDPRIPGVFTRGRGLVRAAGYWTMPDLSRPHSKDGLIDRISALPATRYLVTDDGGSTSQVLDREKLGIFRGIDDLSQYGYPAIVPIRGMKIAGEWIKAINENTREIKKVVYPQYLEEEAKAPFRPKYVPDNQRLPENEAFEILERAVPGVNRNYVKLLLAAKGCAEAGQGPPPMVVVTGPSGSAKSTSCIVAAMLAGDSAKVVSFDGKPSGFHMAIYEASLNASMVVWNEFAKQARDRFGSVISNMTPLLTYTRGLMVRVLYVGNVPVSQVPVFIATDITIPDELRRDRQLGRRFVHVHLDRVVNWERTSQGLEEWRAASRENAHAADSIVSNVIDEFFAGPSMPVFQDIARSLGYRPLSDNDDPDFDPHADLSALFDACRDPNTPSVQDSTFRGQGWKIAQRGREDAITRAWTQVCDDQGPGFGSSRRLKEVDLAQVLGATATVEVDIRLHGTRLGIRFRQGHARSPEVKLNDQIQVANSSVSGLAPSTSAALPSGPRPSADVAARPEITEELV